MYKIDGMKRVFYNYDMSTITVCMYSYKKAGEHRPRLFNCSPYLMINRSFKIHSSASNENIEISTK